MIVLVLSFVIILTGCSNERKNNSDIIEKMNQPKNKNIVWPSSEYTEVILEPENCTFIKEKMINGHTYFGHKITIEDWSIEEAKEYEK